MSTDDSFPGALALACPTCGSQQRYAPGTSTLTCTASGAGTAVYAQSSAALVEHPLGSRATTSASTSSRPSTRQSPSRARTCRCGASPRRQPPRTRDGAGTASLSFSLATASSCTPSGRRVPGWRRQARTAPADVPGEARPGRRRARNRPAPEQQGGREAPHAHAADVRRDPHPRDRPDVRLHGSLRMPPPSSEAPARRAHLSAQPHQEPGS
jgi:hypothetical protein